MTTNTPKSLPAFLLTLPGALGEALLREARRAQLGPSGLVAELLDERQAARGQQQAREDRRRVKDGAP